MSDLISREALLEAYKDSKEIRTYDYDVARLITNAPAVEQGEPVGEVSWFEGTVMRVIYPTSNMPKNGTKLYTTPPQPLGATESKEQWEARLMAECTDPNT